MSRGITYQLSGSRHAVQLAVSLYSLRKQFDGDVMLLAGDGPAFEIAKRLTADPRLNVSIKSFDAQCGKIRNGGYLDKTLVHELSPFQLTIFLDADTLVVGKLDELWPIENEVVLTQFADWVSTGKTIAGRIAKWKNVAPREVQRMLDESHQAINTGVFSFTKWSTYMPAWREMTLRHVSFIADEIASQLIFPDYPTRVLDDRFNASVVYSVGRQDVRVYHGHGGKFIRKESGRAIWLPWFDEAVAENIGGLRDWCPAGDERLKLWLETGTVKA